MTETVSHGRGGQGNIGPDQTEYTDGAIRRAGDPAASGAAYSGGRGGAGNIGSPRQEAVATGRDDDIIPDAARLSVNPEEAHHTGRGGEGNVITPKTKANPHEGLAEKLKRMLLSFGRKRST
ncbi:uncharacterized protein LAJ45_11311 [Morchella importuna]|nr:uncharacterized protein H6S33_001159 [Morchella sextelata]XP_045966021.1 uncharacterized protein LAJ45_11311 [Morchella importuna]KAH0608931.1 hypothetical protein H6S33_001159 [Morchella sextelata]KAH8144717.1 hypothetical protein LAJ45_11311 [Morchella importuna]